MRLFAPCTSRLPRCPAAAAAAAAAHRDLRLLLLQEDPGGGNGCCRPSPDLAQLRCMICFSFVSACIALALTLVPQMQADTRDLVEREL